MGLLHVAQCVLRLDLPGQVELDEGRKMIGQARMSKRVRLQDRSCLLVSDASVTMWQHIHTNTTQHNTTQHTHTQHSSTQLWGGASLLGSLLGRSWGALGRHGGPLEGLMAEILIFHWFYNGLAAQLPWHGRQVPSEPEPWRG